MEDTKSLLMMVLHKIFQNQPKTVENTFQLIHNYNNGKINTREYEQILKTICDLMNDKLPSQILVYLLTLVNMPQEYDSQSSIVEKMRKTRDCLPEINARPHLLEYLNNIKPNLKTKATTLACNSKVKKKKDTSKAESSSSQSVITEDYFIKPKTPKAAIAKVSPKNSEVKSMLAICASYTIGNERLIREMYTNKESKAKQLITKSITSKAQMEQCHKVINDAKKKINLLKAIEYNKFDDLLFEYKESGVSLKISPLFDDDYDPFVLSQEVEDAIMAFRYCIKD